MIYTTRLLLSASILLLLLISVACNEAEPEENAVIEHRKSPIAISSITHDDTYVKIVYGQPYKRGRDIFGSLEPYGTVWRTGANEATEITITNDILLDGHPVEAGTYSLYTIPQPEVWTVILNLQLGQWGAFSYNAQQDYLRFDRPSQQTDTVVEALTMTFSNVEGNRTILTIAWDDTRIDIPVTFP